MKTITTLKALTALATLTAATANAGTAPFSMVSGVVAEGVDITLTLQASSNPGYAYDFIVSNNSDSGIVTGVYFEEGWNTKLWGAGNSDGPALLLPGSEAPDIDGWDESKVSHTIGEHESWKHHGRGFIKHVFTVLEDGIEAGQSQTFSFMTDTDSVSLQDLEDVLGDERFGVAIKVQDLSTDRYAAGFGEADSLDQEATLFGLVSALQQTSEEGGNRDVTGAPTPTAAITGLAMIGILGLRRRRNNA